jgi:hypothetical protein
MQAHDCLVIASHAVEEVYAMPRPQPMTYCGPQTKDNLDQMLSGMLDALRKPPKLTATLKRRALKNKATRKSVAVDPCRQPGP